MQVEGGRSKGFEIVGPFGIGCSTHKEKRYKTKGREEKESEEQTKGLKIFTTADSCQLGERFDSEANEIESNLACF